MSFFMKKKRSPTMGFYIFYFHPSPIILHCNTNDCDEGRRFIPYKVASDPLYTIGQYLIA